MTTYDLLIDRINERMRVLELSERGTRELEEARVRRRRENQLNEAFTALLGAHARFNDSVRKLREDYERWKAPHARALAVESEEDGDEFRNFSDDEESDEEKIILSEKMIEWLWTYTKDAKNRNNIFIALATKDGNRKYTGKTVLIVPPAVFDSEVATIRAFVSDNHYTGVASLHPIRGERKAMMQKFVADMMERTDKTIAAVVISDQADPALERRKLPIDRTDVYFNAVRLKTNDNTAYEEATDVEWIKDMQPINEISAYVDLRKNERQSQYFNKGQQVVNIAPGTNRVVGRGKIRDVDGARKPKEDDYYDDYYYDVEYNTGGIEKLPQTELYAEAAIRYGSKKDADDALERWKVIRDRRTDTAY